MTGDLRDRVHVCHSPIPARAGVGLKPEHYADILETKPDIGWFEVHAENYMGAGGPPHHYLTAIRSDYPLSVHGVGLSIGSHGRVSGVLVMVSNLCQVNNQSPRLVIYGKNNIKVG